jgi:hypothetical protein
MRAGIVGHQGGDSLNQEPATRCIDWAPRRKNCAIVSTIHPSEAAAIGFASSCLALHPSSSDNGAVSGLAEILIIAAIIVALFGVRQLLKR